MPRTTREYLLRFADQALNDLERAISRLKLLSDTYAGAALPTTELEESNSPEDQPAYVGRYANQQHFIDLVAAQVMQANADLEHFRKNYM